MKISYLKIIGLFLVFLFFSSITITSFSYFKDEETIAAKTEIDESTEDETDKILEIINKVNESMLYDYLEELSVNIGPRKAGTSGCEKAAKFIFNEFEKMGLETRYQHFESWTPRHKRYYKSKNIEATLPGTGTNSNEILVINAHYDTVKDAPGAIDDGAGVVSVMTAAYVLSQYEFNRTIKFVTFSAEEVGLLGSRAYVNEIYDEDPEILVELNLDGTGYATTARHGKNLVLYPTKDAHWMCDEIRYINNYYNQDFNIIQHQDIQPGGPRTYTSDFYDFVKHGYEAIAFGGTDSYPYWHTPEDTIDKVNFSILTRTVKIISASLAHLADIEVVHPQIQIVAPKRGRLYFEDVTKKHFEYARTVVIDDFLIRAYVKPGDAPIERVDFFYDGNKVFTDTDKPYQWRLNKISIKEHTVKVVLYDTEGRTAEDQVTFTYINLLRRK